MLPRLVYHSAEMFEQAIILDYEQFFVLFDNSECYFWHVFAWMFAICDDKQKILNDKNEFEP